MTDRWQHVSRLYHEALAHEAPTRAAFLQAACVGDEMLHHEVESLLAHEEAVADFIETPALHAAASLGGIQADAPEMTGGQIGPYKILSLLGVGGMGEVYRARDTKLGRDVAIKVLPSLFTHDLDRRARFEREARLLASLNHPHIAQIHGLEDADVSTSSGPRRIQALVMELVPGETLAEMLSATRPRSRPSGSKPPGQPARALPLDKALAIARQIAEALEAAHEKGIVHRDLKPANIKVTPDGVVKVLDFGLAKATTGDSTATDRSQVPTITDDGTREGSIVGTAAYMSPEQARGQPVDKRTDIWAFGCVLYEMLTGRLAFAGETSSDTLAQVLTRDPHWNALPPDTPAGLRRLLGDALVRDSKERLHDIGDARIAIAHLLRDTPESVLRVQRSRLPWLVAGAFGLIAAVAVSFPLVNARKTTLTEVPVRKLTLPRPGGNPGNFFVSPDGQWLLFGSSWAPFDGRSVSAAIVRRMDGTEWRELPGTAGGYAFFWSPDSRQVGFVQGTSLNTVDLVGSQPRILCSGCITGPGSSSGGTWNRDGVIVFSPGAGQLLFRIADGGGEIRPVTELDSARQETEHFYPSFLPDGRRFLFTARSHTGNHCIKLGSIDSGIPECLVSSYSRSVYASGSLLFVRDGALLALPFDADQGKVTGDPVVLEKDVWNGLSGQADFSVSAEGTIVIVPAVPSHYWWVDRTGKRIEELNVPATDATGFRVAPDGSSVVMSLPDREKGSTDIYVVDRVGGQKSQLTFDPEVDLAPIWSPEGDRVMFTARRQHEPGIYVRATQGAEPEKLLIPYFGTTLRAKDWSPDGSDVLVNANPTGKSMDIMRLSMHNGSSLEAWLRTPFNESNPRFSPDGKWVAYQSDETGGAQIYLRSFPGGTVWRRVTTAGGTFPVWSRDGKEIFYWDFRGHLMAISIRMGPALDVDAPRDVFPLANAFTFDTLNYDVDAQGRFLLNLLDGPAASYPPSLVLNWPKLVKR
jgi:serine/threonine protein kinase/Tol biopolymer transport system component